MAKRITKKINSQFNPTLFSGYPIYAYGGPMEMSFQNALLMNQNIVNPYKKFGGKIPYNTGGWMIPTELQQQGIRATVNGSIPMQSMQSINTPDFSTNLETSQLDPMSITGSNQTTDSNMGVPYEFIGNTIGNIADSITAKNNRRSAYDKTSVVGGVAKGVATGAAAGSALGPVGTIAGGLIGGASSAFSAISQNKEAEFQFRQAKEESLKEQMISNLPAQHDYQPTFAMGGRLTSSSNILQPRDSQGNRRYILKEWAQNRANPPIDFGGGSFGGAGAGSTFNNNYKIPIEWTDTRIPVEGDSFNDAFRKARKAGKKEFNFNNKKFNTDLGPDSTYNPNAGKIKEQLRLRMLYDENNKIIQDSTRFEPELGQPVANTINKNKKEIDYFKYGGKINPSEIVKGTKEEMEHTSSRKVSRKTTMDHLKEDPKYYSKLKKAGLADSYPNGGMLSPKKFTQNYIQSPKYKERLLSSGYANPEEEVNSRLSNVNNTKVFGQYGNPDLVKQAEFELTNRPYTKGGSSYLPAQNAIVVDHKQAKQLGVPPQSIEAHEFGHSEVNSGLGNPGEIRNSRLNDYDNSQIINRLLPNANSKYKTAPDEIKSDLNSLRYELLNKGIYNTETEDFNQNYLNQIKDSYIKDRLGKNYSDEDLIWLMNNIAKKDNNSNKKVAANGGVLNSYTNGGNITKRLSEVNSNQTHEQSPIGGVPVGNNALVEDGEFLYTTKDGQKYVFSNRY